MSVPRQKRKDKYRRDEDPARHFMQQNLSFTVRQLMHAQWDLHGLLVRDGDPMFEDEQDWLRQQIEMLDQLCSNLVWLSNELKHHDPAE